MDGEKKLLQYQSQGHGKQALQRDICIHQLILGQVECTVRNPITMHNINVALAYGTRVGWDDTT